MANSAQGDDPWNLANGKTFAPKALCATAWCAGRIRVDTLEHKLSVGEQPACFGCGTLYKAPVPGSPGTSGAKGKGFATAPKRTFASVCASIFSIVEDDVHEQVLIPSHSSKDDVGKLLLGRPVGPPAENHGSKPKNPYGTGR